MKSQDDRGGRWTWLLLAALVAAAGVRFARLEMDAPHSIFSQSGEFLTDEGWYTKSAQLHAKFGVWTNDFDMVWFSHNSLFTLVAAAAFHLFGVGVEIARGISVVAFCATTAGLYAIVRSVQPRGVALAACLIPAVTLQTFAYSRMALAEPTGVAFSVLALAAWVRLPRGVGACAAGLLLAAAAHFAKISFIYTICALVVLSLHDAFLLARERRWGATGAVVALAAAVPLAASAIQRRVADIAPEQAAMFDQWHVQSRMEELASGDHLLNEAKAAFKVTTATGGVALVAALAILVPLALMRRKGRPLLPVSRATFAMAVWGLGGTAFFGIFEYQPARYFYFTIFPLAYAAVVAMRAVVPPARTAAALSALLLAHAAAQVPGFATWLGRDDLMSLDRAARDAVARMELGPGREPVAVMGGSAAYLSLYDDRIVPLDYRYNDWFPERVGHWRPKYLFTFPTQAYHMPPNCPGLVERVEPMASYRLLDNYYTHEDQVLYRVVYAK